MQKLVLQERGKEGNVEKYHKYIEEPTVEKCFVIPLAGSTIIGALRFVNAVKKLNYYRLKTDSSLVEKQSKLLTKY